MDRTNLKDKGIIVTLPRLTAADGRCEYFLVRLHSLAFLILSSLQRFLQVGKSSSLLTRQELMTQSFHLCLLLATYSGKLIHLILLSDG